MRVAVGRPERRPNNPDSLLFEKRQHDTTPLPPSPSARRRAESRPAPGSSGSPPTVRPFPRKQLAMPSENGVRRHERRDVSEYGASQPLPEHRETPPLRHRSSSRRPASCAFKARFSSRGNAIASRCSRSSHPSSATSNIWNGITVQLYANSSLSESSDKFGRAGSDPWSVLANAAFGHSAISPRTRKVPPLARGVTARGRRVGAVWA
jgi:hypothetical protein